MSEWEAYNKIEPLGEWRQDYRIASLEALIVNVVSSLYAKEGESPEMVDPIEFMPDYSGDLGPLKEELKQKKLKQGLMRMVAGLGGDRVDPPQQSSETKGKGASTL